MINVSRQTWGILKVFPLNCKDFCINLSTVLKISEGEWPVLFSTALAGKSGMKSWLGALAMISMKDLRPPTWPSGYDPRRSLSAPTLHPLRRSLREAMNYPEQLAAGRKVRNRTQGLELARGVVTSELRSPKNSEQTVKPVWKRCSHEQRVGKAPKQKPVPQHWDDVEMRKIPAKGKQVR